MRGSYLGNYYCSLLFLCGSSLEFTQTLFLENIYKQSIYFFTINYYMQVFTLTYKFRLLLLVLRDNEGSSKVVSSFFSSNMWHDEYYAPIINEMYIYLFNCLCVEYKYTSAELNELLSTYMEYRGFVNYTIQLNEITCFLDIIYQLIDTYRKLDIQHNMMPDVDVVAEYKRYLGIIQLDITEYRHLFLFDSTILKPLIVCIQDVILSSNNINYKKIEINFNEN